MKDVYPEYEDGLAFYAVGIDPTENAQTLEQYAKEQGYPWPIAQAGREMLTDLKVIQQSSKLAFDAEGIVTYRAGYGKGNVETWRGVIEGLIAGR